MRLFVLKIYCPYFVLKNRYLFRGWRLKINLLRIFGLDSNSIIFEIFKNTYSEKEINSSKRKFTTLSFFNNIFTLERNHLFSQQHKVVVSPPLMGKLEVQEYFLIRIQHLEIFLEYYEQEEPAVFLDNI